MTKALVHLKIQRKFLIGEDVAKRKDTEKSDEGPRLASSATFIPTEEEYLESAFGVLNYIEARTDSVWWESYNLTLVHHQWPMHILLPYRCWDERRNERRIDVVLPSFIKHSIDPNRDASWLVIRDYWFMVNPQMELPMHQDDLYILDQR